jgi:hypothetical protein
MRSSGLPSVFIFVLFAAATAHADPPKPPAKPPVAKPAPDPDKRPVHIGPTTVTVIDEQESVDDIISRVRRGNQKHPTPQATPANTPTVITPAATPATGEPRRVIDKVRDRADRADKERLRERPRRLREQLRENRIRNGRAD